MIAFIHYLTIPHLEKCVWNDNFAEKRLIILKKVNYMKKSIEALIPKIQEYFSQQPIEKAWIFGSCSRGENTKNSDVDILVKYTENQTISLFTISKIMVNLSKLINKKVDLVEDGQLMDFAVESVNRDKILIYERKD